MAYPYQCSATCTLVKNTLVHDHHWSWSKRPRQISKLWSPCSPCDLRWFRPVWWRELGNKLNCHCSSGSSTGGERLWEWPTVRWNPLCYLAWSRVGRCRPSETQEYHPCVVSWMSLVNELRGSVGAIFKNVLFSTLIKVHSLEIIGRGGMVSFFVLFSL